MATHAPAVIGAKPLRVELDPVGKQQENLRRFEGYGGKDVIVELLKKAGLTGTWKVRMFDTFKSSGRTPTVQIRRSDTHGVIIWWKPGSNDSGMRSELMVTRDCGFSPEQIYHKLKAVAEGHQPGLPARDDRTDYAVIKLVNRANAASFGDRMSFVGDIHGQLLKRPPDGVKVHVPDDTLDILEDMADRGILYEDGHVFRVGRLGQELQFRMDPAPVEVAPVPVIPPAAAAALPVPTDPLTAIRAYQAQLARLANLPEEIEKLRKRRLEISEQILELTAEDGRLIVEEKQLLCFDVEALALLLGPPTRTK